MKSSIVDSSVIIHLAKLGYLDYLFKLFNKVYVTNFVIREVLREDKPEHDKIKEFLERVEKIDINLDFNSLKSVIKLDIGEYPVYILLNVKILYF